MSSAAAAAEPHAEPAAEQGLVCGDQLRTVQLGGGAVERVVERQLVLLGYLGCATQYVRAGYEDWTDRPQIVELRHNLRCIPPERA